MKVCQRRKLLKQMSGLFAVALSACGGGAGKGGVALSTGPSPNAYTPAASAASSPAVAQAAAVTWNPVVPEMEAGSGAAFDLATTLPPDVLRGGVFGLSLTSSPLPAGMSLSSAGVLSVGQAGVGRDSGIVFSYAS